MTQPFLTVATTSNCVDEINCKIVLRWWLCSGCEKVLILLLVNAVSAGFLWGFLTLG